MSGTIKQRWELERIRRAIFTLLSDYEARLFAEDPEVTISKDHLLAKESLLLRVTQCMYGHDVESICVRYPDGWVEAFKDRYFRSWLRKKFPVKYIKETMTKKIVYPEMIIPDQEHIVYLETDLE